MERLTQQEEEVMIYFWKMGPSFIREIVNEMPEPKPPYTSVASVVRNLEKKKFLSPFKLGNSIQYHVLVKESDYKRSFMNGVVSNYFTGSYKEMVSFFVRDRKISKKELEDTFFRLRRIMLLLICVTSLIYPLIDFSGWTDEYAIGETFTTVYNKLLPEVLVTTALPVATTEVEVTTWQAGTWLWIIYGLGIGMLLLRNLLEVSKIHRSLVCSQRYSLKGVPVYQSEDVGEPCSFFHWIFINPMQYSDKEINEILIHEQTHVRELHSLDIILVQLVILLCWFNPFSWLIRSEIRMNHEYLADKQVVTSGYDKKSYQYHLLGIKHTSLAAANFYNNFSVLPLKKRIKMLNRKRTHNIMVGKYLMFIPVAALLLLFSNCANKKADKVQSDTEKADTIELTAEPEKTAEPQVDITITETKGDSIYSVVETMPDFPGGQKELLSFLSRNIKYPTKAIENKIQGRVIVQFVVNKDGSIFGAKVVRSVDPDLDKEALRVINSMPKWKPGMQKGEPVSVKFTVPIVFRNQLN